MRRRDFLQFAVGSAALWPAPVLAQLAPGKTFRIGVFSGADNPIMRPAYRAFIEELQKLGYIEGQNLTVEYRSTLQDATALMADAREMVRLKVDMVAALGAEVVLKAVAAVTHTIPIVFVANNYDPIALGYVRTLAKPGGNITGIYLRQTELAEKQIELLLEAAPGRRRVAALWDAISTDQFAASQRRAQALGIHIQSLKMENPPYDLDAAFRAMADAGSQALLALTSPFLAKQSQSIIDLAIRHRLPSMFIFKPYTLAGGLMSYGADNIAMYRQSASLVAKILQGANPADLPVEQPVKFDLAVNLKTAKAIGIELPTSILLRANDVIE
jgi:putative ABC transport system substrate-binding protein